MVSGSYRISDTIVILTGVTVAASIPVHEPNLLMQETGSEIIRHVGGKESETGYQSDAANVWRFMTDALHQDGRHKMAEVAARAAG